MPRLTPVRRRKFIAVIEMNGLREIKGAGKGSHGVWEHPENVGKRTVVPDYSEIGVDLLRRMIKEVRKTRQEYQDCLREV